MDTHIDLINDFKEKGLSSLLDKFDTFLNSESVFINCIILNLTNKTNIDLLSNFIKTNIIKYKSLIKNIINTSFITNANKYLFFSSIFNKYENDNLEILELVYPIIDTFLTEVEDLYSNDNLLLKSDIVYNIFNIDIYSNTSNELNNIYTTYLYPIFVNILENSKTKFIKWLYILINSYKDRCKTYNANTIKTDSILYNLLNCILMYHQDNNIGNNVLDYIVTKQDLVNDTFTEISETFNDDSIIYNVLILKFIKITVYYSINEYNTNNNLIDKYKDTIDTIENNNSLVNTFDILKNYIVKNNSNKIVQYEKKNTILSKKLNLNLLESTYKYYVDILLDFIDNKSLLINNELFNSFMEDIIDFYIFYHKYYSYVYKNLQEKYTLISFFKDIFRSSISNVNLNIKIMDFFVFTIKKHNIFSLKKNNVLLVSFNTGLRELTIKTFEFYVDLDTYDELYRPDIKNTIINTCNLIFNVPHLFSYILNDIFKDDILLNRFLISFTEDLHLYHEEFYKYYTKVLNKDERSDTYKIIYISYFTYIEESLYFLKYIFLNYYDIVTINISKIIFDKFNYDFLYLGKLFIKYNNTSVDNTYVSGLIKSMTNVYLALSETEHLNNIKSDTHSYDYDVFKETCELVFTTPEDESKLTNILKLFNTINNLSINNESNITIPDDFLDPLSNDLIEIPIHLPSSNTIIDFNVIKQHLLYYDFDPFNRTKLTLEQINEYNNTDIIKKKNNDLLEKINQWKINNNY
tara:strand:- start:1802 stop:4048 length:2247 start_codon:yes stop_codon:yes gene_type:complete